MTMPNNCSRRNFVNSTLAPSTLRFALIGDYDAAVTAHTAIPVALRLAGDALSQPVEPFWIHTSELNSEESIRSLRQFQGIWCVPASPYANTEGALSAIRLARLEGIPFLGTCGGFQHAMLEYFRNELGVANAGHEELDPTTANPILSRLSCSLVEATASIHLTPGSFTAQLYGADQVQETFHCNYGMTRRPRNGLGRTAKW
jgi:CTP synthase (UTP-ammonia lyase)